MNVKYTIMVSCLCCLMAAHRYASAEPLKLTIFREFSSAECVSGYLAVNGKQIVYTLERPDIANINDISAIPVGNYPAILRYDHEDRWRIELRDVPNRTNVQIHVGNWTSDSHGCILVGTSINKDLCSMKGSAKAYNVLRNAFYAARVAPPFPDATIEVQVIGTIAPNHG